MATSRKAQDLKAKEAKQKKILAVGLVLLVILMVVQMPKLMHHGGNVQAAPAVPTTPPVPEGAAAPAGLNPPGVAAPTALGSTTPTSTTSSSTTPGSALADTDVVPAAPEGTLVQFDLFASKDPFVQQVRQAVEGGGDPGGVPEPNAPTAPAASDAGGGAASGSGGGIGTGGAATAPKGPVEPMTAVARLSIDGNAEQVRAAGDFPAASPVFHLVSFDARQARISVLGGAYQNGAPTLKLAKGRAVTLMNTADGTRYRIVYLGRTKLPTASLQQPDPAQATPTAPAASPVPGAPTAPPTSTTPSTPPSTPTAPGATPGAAPPAG